MITISAAPSDAILGTIDLQPILGTDGSAIDYLVTRTGGTGSTLLFGDITQARGHRTSELGPSQTLFLEQLLHHADRRSGVTVDLHLLTRVMRVHLTEAVDGTVSINFARIDPSAGAPPVPADDEPRIARLVSMMSALADGVAMYDPVRDDAGTIIDFTCIEMSDADPVIPAREQIGRRLLELYPEMLHNGIFDGYRRAYENSEPWVVDPVVYERNDQRYVYRLRVSVVDDHLILSWRDTLVETTPDGSAPTGERLTDRQLTILQAIADGRSTAEIAASTILSPFTVRNEVRRILAKLGVRSRVEAVSVALTQGLIVTRSELP